MTETPSVTERPGRPLGLSLAILACVCLFSLFPLGELGLKLIIQERFSRFEEIMIPSFDEEEPFVGAIASGGSVTLVTETELWLQAGLGVAFLIVCIFAWRGRPPWVRYVLFVMVLGLTLLSAAITLSQLLSPPALEDGITSADGFFQQARCGQLVLTILIPLYMIWYMNRAPARAFYRGYYLPTPTGEDDQARSPG